MLYFLKVILYFFKGSSMHRVLFVQKHHPLSKWLLYIWKGSLLYKRLYNTILKHTLSKGLGYFLKGMLHTFERNNVYTCMSVCMHVCMYLCMYACMSIFIDRYVSLYIEHVYAVNYVTRKWQCIFQMNIYIHMYTYIHMYID